MRSDWPDLNDLCHSNNIQLNWINTNGGRVNISDALITDSNVHAEAILRNHDGTNKRLSSRAYRYEIYHHFQDQQRNYWVNLRLQGISSVRTVHTVSHVVPQNSAVNEGIYALVIKARIQTLPTKYNLSLWFPKHHDQFCLLHSDRIAESTAHLMNSCPAFKGLYIARQDRIVNIRAKELRKTNTQSEIHINKTVQMNWFSVLNSNANALSTVIRDSPNTPDIVVVDDVSKNILILEIGCCFDLYMDMCFSEKILKYQPLTNALTLCGYNTKLIVLIYGILGHVHRLCVRGTLNKQLNTAMYLQ